MTRRTLAIGLVIGVFWAGVASAAAQTASTASPATPENAAAFVGEWAITAKGSYGDINATVVLKAADGKVAGEITDTTGKHDLGDISRSGESLVAYYRFDYNGTPVDAVVTLTPNDKEKRTDAYLDMANGAAQFAGTAVKK